MKFVNETMVRSEQAGLTDEINKYYFQFRIDKLPEGNQNPRICFGVCRENFDHTKDVSRQVDVWGFYLFSGDKITNKKWKNYYEMDMIDDNTAPPKHGLFAVGNIIGMLVDIDRGMINFYKDSNDLGQAFVDDQLREGQLFPFIQTQVECEIHIFHPWVFPDYKPPPTPGEILLERISKALVRMVKQAEKDERKRKRNLRNLGYDPEYEKKMEELDAEIQADLEEAALQESNLDRTMTTD